MKSKVVALSAISAAFVAVFLTVGALVDFIDVIMITAASVFVTLPLYYKSYKGSILCYLAGGVIGALFALGLGKLVSSVVIPSYFAFFGIYPIILKRFKEKNVNKAVYYIVGLLWCVAAIYGMYFYYVNIIGVIDNLPTIISDNIYWFVALFGVIFFFVYERFLTVSSRLADSVIKRILKDKGND